MADLRALAELAESGSGTDRELNALVDATLRIGKASHPAWIRNNFPAWRPRPDGRVEVVGADGTGGVNRESVDFSGSIEAAKSLFPWEPHPCATLTTRIVQSGVGQFLCWVEFTWPSTETQGRAQDEARATLACALRAIQRTNEELARFQKAERKKA
jgi:hypothetical protein